MTTVTSIYEQPRCKPRPSQDSVWSFLITCRRVRLPHSRPVEPTARLLELDS